MGQAWFLHVAESNGMVVLASVVFFLVHPLPQCSAWQTLEFLHDLFLVGRARGIVRKTTLNVPPLLSVDK